jgi:glutathione synthase/RimK-type ligase-like ATP-grasp enzyme
VSGTLRVAILTPDPDGALGGTRWPSILARLVAPLEAAGLAVESPAWTKAGDLTRFDLVLPLLAWGYHREGDWQGQVASWQAEGVRLRNPPDVLRWNADKSYLPRLAEAGAPIVPTRFVEHLDEAALREAARAFGTDRLIVKPRVSAGAFQTIRWSRGTSLAGGPDRAAMIQPYLPDIESGGEPSLIYLGGAFSHAVSKRPRPGDFRVQPEYDSAIAPYAPLPDELEAAEAAVKAAGADLLYARVDLVRGLDGRPVLMELELVEPDLYLEYHAAAPGRFADAVRRAAAIR